MSLIFPSARDWVEDPAAIRRRRERDEATAAVERARTALRWCAMTARQGLGLCACAMCVSGDLLEGFTPANSCEPQG